MSSWIIGAVSAAYYAGLVLGSFRIEPLIYRIGHIRAFATFASISAVVTMLPGLIMDPWVWIALRFIGGFCMAGLFVVIESWLLASSSANNRGQILSFYMVALYAAQAGGQFFLNLSDPTSLIPFAIATILCSLSVVPVAMTYVETPKHDEPSALGFIQLYKISPSGVIGAGCSGLILGAIYGLLPLFASQTGHDISGIAMIMGVTILGGMALQYPIGHLSDFLDRRKMLIAVTALNCLISIIIMIVAYHFEIGFLVCCFILGGLSFVIYPLSISHACDYLEAKDIVAASQGLLLAYGVGATIGPLIAPAFFKLLGPLGLFAFFILVSGFLTVFFSWRKTKRVSVPVEEQQNFVMSAVTSPVASELDPRLEETPDDEDATSP